MTGQDWYHFLEGVPSRDAAATPCGLKVTSLQDPGLPCEEICIFPPLECIKCILPCELIQRELMCGKECYMYSSEVWEAGADHFGHN